MKTGEPQALMILNSLELLGILRVADESLRTFKKTGRTSIPNVLGEFISVRGETAVMSTTFHEALQKGIEPLEKKRMQIERKTMNKLYKTFLEKNA
jgi:carbamoylphosphate synthase large subunit